MVSGSNRMDFVYQLHNAILFVAYKEESNLTSVDLFSNICMFGHVTIKKCFKWLMTVDLKSNISMLLKHITG